MKTYTLGLAVLILSSIITGPVGAQNDFVRKQMAATLAPAGSISVDGRLDDSIWAEVQFVSDFLQKLPVENGKPTYRTEIGIAYDEDAVYVAARMFYPDPDNLRMYLDRRDTQGPTEQLIVSLDTYLDRRTAYGFGISASGVRFDRFQNDDKENPKDFSYNPVWSARVAYDRESWTVEMRIPFSQLRFQNIAEQTWGINVNRWIPELNEDIFWIVIPLDEEAWASQFGNLTGIKNIRKSRRIEVLPYAAGDGRFMGGVNPADPFHDNSDFAGRIGGDMKMGLGPNVTLEATFNPDFGQVEADPAEVNLSQYETIFSERRPFFVEGNQLFSTIGPTFFYSRRIGSSPHMPVGSNNTLFVDQPGNSTILGAAKMTGRIGSGTSIALLSAVTSEESAELQHLLIDSIAPFDTTRLNASSIIEPTTFFNVARVQQEFGSSGSRIGLAATAVNRDLSGKPELRQVVNESAYAGSVEWDVNFGDDQFDLVGQAGFSHVRADSQRILSLQQSSVHYYQRPDADHVELDSNKTSMSGGSGLLVLRKLSGGHWLYEAGAAFYSPGFDLNDAGVMRSTDNIDSWAGLVYREQQPRGMFRNYRFGLEVDRGWNFDGIIQYTGYSVDMNATFMNFWSTEVSVDYSPGGYSDDRTRGGPIMKTEALYEFDARLSSNRAGGVHGGLSFGSWFSEYDGRGNDISADIQARLGKSIQLSIFPGFSYNNNPRQWVDALDGGSEATYGTRYIFGRLKQTEFYTQIRLNYFFTPDLSLQLYAEPFVSSGQYSDYGELVAGGTNDLLLYGTNGTTIDESLDGSEYVVTDGAATFTVDNPDYSKFSFRSNIVLRWEFSAGSTLYLVWQRNLGGEFDSRLHRVRPDDLFRTLDGDGVDFVALKISYWIPLS